ncbi:ankyrin-3-like [Schistocerca gregaria]|uniref:ankyrin-3-like n=1 Tax=Schistocerca gregaria TaxID=7010 RepID=UPI00211EBFDA|nr:ankyrin-3-like [Schistocerca gregaria]
MDGGRQPQLATEEAAYEKDQGGGKQGETAHVKTSSGTGSGEVAGTLGANKVASQGEAAGAAAMSGEAALSAAGKLAVLEEMHVSAAGEHQRMGRRTCECCKVTQRKTEQPLELTPTPEFIFEKCDIGYPILNQFRSCADLIISCAACRKKPATCVGHNECAWRVADARVSRRDRGAAAGGVSGATAKPSRVQGYLCGGSRKGGEGGGGPDQLRTDTAHATLLRRGTRLVVQESAKCRRYFEVKVPYVAGRYLCPSTMSCRCTAWLLSISVAVAVATHCSYHESTTGSSAVEAVPEAEEGEEAAADLSGLLDAGPGAVVTLEAGGVRLAAHRALLAARSPALAAELQQAEGVGGRLRLQGVDGAVLRHLLAYLYTLRPPQLPEMAAQLLAAADRFGLAALKAACGRELEAQLSVENAAATAVLAARHSSAGLQRAAAAFIAAHAGRVRATRGWAEALRSEPAALAEVLSQMHDPPAETAYLPGEDKGWRLIDAAERGETEELQKLLASGADVGARNWLGMTALHWAALRGDLEAARSLVECGADVDVLTTLLQVTPLHMASLRGFTEMVQLLLASSADPKLRAEGGVTPLHLAALSGQTEVVTALLDAGAEVDARTKTTWLQLSPLHLASTVGNTAVVQLLVASSADPNARARRGVTPLHLAAVSGRPEAAAALLEAGADRWATTHDGRTPLDFAKEHGERNMKSLLSAPPAGGGANAAPAATAAPAAARSHYGDGSPSEVTAAPPTAPPCFYDDVPYSVKSLWCLSGEGKRWRLINAAKKGYVKEIQRLLEIGADVGARDWLGITALHFAAYGGHVEAVKYLVESGAQVDTLTTFLQITPLHMASLSGHPAVVRALLASSADPRAMAEGGVTPLHLAAGSNDTEAVTALVESGVEVDARTRNTWLQVTPLHLASLKGSAAVVRLLVASSANPNVRAEGGLTPLHLAALGGQRDAAAALLEAGASRRARTDDGRTPLDFVGKDAGQDLTDILRGHE